MLHVNETILTYLRGHYNRLRYVKPTKSPWFQDFNIVRPRHRIFSPDFQINYSLTASNVSDVIMTKSIQWHTQDSRPLSGIQPDIHISWIHDDNRFRNQAKGNYHEWHAKHIFGQHVAAQCSNKPLLLETLKVNMLLVELSKHNLLTLHIKVAPTAHSR